MKYRAWIKHELDGTTDELIGDWDEVVDFLIAHTEDCCDTHPVFVAARNGRELVDVHGIQVEDMVDSCGFSVEVGVEVVD